VNNPGWGTANEKVAAVAVTPIYLDNNATTRPDPRVVEAMLPYLSDRYGNAASTGHSFGWDAQQAVDNARASVAALIGAQPSEIVFTSGATESDNLALRGVCAAYQDKGRHIVTSTIEHMAILDTAAQLASTGTKVTYLPVDNTGRVDLNELDSTITPETVLVSIMLANNEIGTVQDVESIGALCHSRGVLFHTDATQGVGKMPVDVVKMRIDLLSMSAHKMHGPKGVGALYVRRRDPRVTLMPQITGGGHEGGRRSGTLNTPGIVGFGGAAHISLAEMPSSIARQRATRDRLEGALLQIPGTRLNGHPSIRLPNTLNVLFSGVEADAIMAAVPEVAMSPGSACSSASITVSHVLTAIGLSDRDASCSLRLSTSRFTTEAEVDRAAGRIAEAVVERRRIMA
jgi:cysteine desulfurase